MKGGARVIVEGHRHDGVFVARGKEDALVTKNMCPGVSVYGEKRISVEGPGEGAEKVEYRVWNPFRSKLAAAVLAGVDNIYMKPGSKVLYLGAASGTSVSHVSDLVGPEGTVYAVEFSHRSGRDLVNMAKKRPNVVPIIEDARHPQKYRMLVPMVDVVFADVAQPDQARIVGLNAQYFLKNKGNFVISVKASCIDSTAPPEAVFAREVKKLQEHQLKPKEQVRSGSFIYSFIGSFVHWFIRPTLLLLLVVGCFEALVWVMTVYHMIDSRGVGPHLRARVKTRPQRPVR